MSDPVFDPDFTPDPFDAVALTPQEAERALLRRELQSERYREHMARQVIATRDATVDALRLDAARAGQGGLPRLRRWVQWAAAGRGRWPGKLRSGLFLPNWYRQRYSDRVEGSPAAHYLLTGLGQDLAPNPFFDPEWYRARHMTAGEDGEPAILHYVRIGARHGLSPGPLFDAVAYLRAYPAVSSTSDALYDFLVQGVAFGRRATPVPLPLSSA